MTDLNVYMYWQKGAKEAPSVLYFYGITILMLNDDNFFPSEYCDDLYFLGCLNILKKYLDLICVLIVWILNKLFFCFFFQLLSNPTVCVRPLSSLISQNSSLVQSPFVQQHNKPVTLLPAVRNFQTTAVTRDIDSAAKFIGAGAATVGVAGSGINCLSPTIPLNGINVNKSS